MSILVSKTGSPFYTDGQRGFPDMCGIWAYLRENHDATYVGVTRGPEIGALEINTHGFDQDTSAEELVERWFPVLETCRELNPTCFVVLEGATPTWSWPDNPSFARTFAFAIRYNAAILWLIHMLDIPRISIVTDPKCYPRDSEMTTMWPNIMPYSILSQENRVWNRKIQGVPLRCEAVYAKCENWLLHGRHIPQPRDRDLLIAGNNISHVKEQRLKKTRQDVWHHILDNWLAVHNGTDTQICGRGWDHWYRSDVFIGWLPEFDDVMEHISRGVGGPMIPQTDGFLSTKPRMHALMGSVPLFNMGMHAYDSSERILSMNHPSRIDGLTTRHLTDQLRADTIGTVLKRTVPDFSMLDRAIAGERIGGYDVI